MLTPVHVVELWRVSTPEVKISISGPKNLKISSDLDLDLMPS